MSTQSPKVDHFKLVALRIRIELMLPTGPLQAACIRWIRQQCTENKAARIDQVDSGWDVSMHGVTLDAPINMSAFEIIADFLDYPTGNTLPTYCSGSGFYAETYRECMTDFVAAYMQMWLETHLLWPYVCDEQSTMLDAFDDYLVLHDLSACAYVERLALMPFPMPRLVRAR